MTPDKPLVFLSSVFVDDFGSGRVPVPLRKRIIEKSPSLPVNLWAYELYWPQGSETTEPDPDTVVDRCFRGVKKCDLFVFLLTGRHGSGVDYDSHPVLASYLELELFAAAMLDKPTLVLHIRNKEPENELRDALLLLRRRLPADDYAIDDEDGLYTKFVNTCHSLAGGIPLVQSQNLSGLAEWLSLKRSRDRMDQELSNPFLRFLDDRLPSEKKNINPEQASCLLDQVASGHRLVGVDMLRMPHGAALCRLWAAMRELMDDKGTAIWAIGRDADAQQGARAIRGHAFMQTARLGRVWNLRHAKHDFERSLELREKAGANPSSIGEAKTDLGLCLVLLGAKGSGLSLLQEGMALLRTGDSANAQSFLAWGLRKLERAAALSGKRDLAESARLECIELSSEIEAFDQARHA